MDTRQPVVLKRPLPVVAQVATLAAPSKEVVVIKPSLMAQSALPPPPPPPLPLSGHALDLDREPLATPEELLEPEIGPIGEEIRQAVALKTDELAQGRESLLNQNALSAKRVSVVKKLASKQSVSAHSETSQFSDEMSDRDGSSSEISSESSQPDEVASPEQEQEKEQEEQSSEQGGDSGVSSNQQLAQEAALKTPAKKRVRIKLRRKITKVVKKQPGRGQTISEASSVSATSALPASDSELSSATSPEPSSSSSQSSSQSVAVTLPPKST